MSLKFVPKGPINNITTVLRIYMGMDFMRLIISVRSWTHVWVLLRISYTSDLCVTEYGKSDGPS